MNFGIRDRVAIVSGGSKGVGRAIASELAAEGVKVAIIARGAEALEDTVETIRQAGGQAIGIRADMTVADEVYQAVGHTTEVFGSPTIAISNVESPDARPERGFRCGFDDASEEDFIAAYDTLVMSVVHLTRAVLPAMKAQRWGRLVNIGSRCVKQPHAPPTTMILSNINRLGVVGLMKTLSLEYGKYGITANVIATGRIATETSQAFFNTLGQSKEQQETAMREAGIGVCRLGRPEELAALATFLCSERAGFISGETYTITGGMHAGIF